MTIAAWKAWATACERVYQRCACAGWRVNGHPHDYWNKSAGAAFIGGKPARCICIFAVHSLAAAFAIIPASLGGNGGKGGAWAGIRYTFGEENKFGILSPSKVRNGSVRSARKRNFSFKKYRKNTVPTVIIVLEFNSRYFIKLFFFVKLSGYFLNLNYSRASFFFRSRSLRN